MLFNILTPLFPKQILSQPLKARFPLQWWIKTRNVHVTANGGEGHEGSMKAVREENNEGWE